MSETTVADCLIHLLYASGVREIFGIIGDSLNPIGDAVRRHDGIRWISVRHEESGAFAACAQSELTEKLAVCAGTCGPGSVHLAGGVYEATANGTPVLFIATQFPSREIGLNYFQATHPAPLFQDAAVFCETVNVPDQMPRLLTAAIQAAYERRGGAVLIFPKDVSEKQIKPSPYDRPACVPPAIVQPKANDIQKAADMLNATKRITCYCGYGCRNAVDKVISLAATLQAPVVTTLRAKCFIDNANPYCVGTNGLLSDGEASKALETCDLLLLLGTDFPFEKAIPTRPKVIQVDNNSVHLGLRSVLTLGIKGDIGTTLDMLLPLLREKQDNDGFLKNALAYRQEKENDKLSDLKDMESDLFLRAEYLTHVLSDVAADNAVFVIDVGLNDVWATRYLQAMGKRCFIGSFKYGCMGAATPYGIGTACTVDETTPVIVLAGDGGLCMYLGELTTLVQHRLPVKIIVYNNNCLGFINWEAHMDKIPPFATRLCQTDFSKIAQDIGLSSFKVDSPAGLANILKTALETDGPVLIDAHIKDPLSGFQPTEDQT